MMLDTHHLEKVRQYVSYCVSEKDVSPLRFHQRFKPYTRKQSTFDLLRKAQERRVIFEPRLLCLPDIEVNFIEYTGNPLIDLYEEKKKDPNVTYIMVLTGAYSLIYFSHGTRILKFVSCTTPSYPAITHFDEIDPTQHGKGELPEMKKPENWEDLHWDVYRARKNPKRSSIKVGRELHVSYRTVLNYFNEILPTCEIWIPFFPNGYHNYANYILTLKTDYETGLVKELKKLDRSSYVYKADKTLILSLFFDRHLEIDSFLKLEKEGVIHDMRVSFPVDSSNVFYTLNW